MKARTNKLKFEFYSETNRGVVAANDIDKDEEVMFVPDDAMLSQFRARSVEWSKRLIEFGFDDIAVYKEAAYYIIYLMHMTL